MRINQVLVIGALVAIPSPVTRSASVRMREYGGHTFAWWHSRVSVSGLNNFLAIQYFVRAAEVAYTRRIS